MAPSSFRKAIGAVKDKTSIGLAKVSSTSSLSDLDVAIVKATRHEEYPAEERHIREILSLTSYSRAYISACVITISRRLNKTSNWTVALKTLMLIQRVLSEGDPAYEQEIFFATRRGTRILNMAHFHDTSRSDSWDYSAFVRTYALYLDERLEFKMQGRRGKRSAVGIFDEEEDDDHDYDETSPSSCSKTTPVHEMKNERIFSKMQHLQQLLERFLACRPTGSAKYNRVVIVALYPIVKESFQIYYDITEIMGVLIDRFMDLDVRHSIKVYEIFSRVGKQFEELENFYNWCKNIGIARSSDYPEVEKVTPKKLQLMDEFIRDKQQTQKNKSLEQENENEEDKVLEEAEANEEDVNSIKALPPPEEFCEFPEEQKEEPKEEEKKDNKKQEEFADLLNLGDNAVTSEQHADKLALALFDCGTSAATGSSSAPAWEAFSEDAADWETALVQSASNLSNPKASLGGGFDILLLDGMYQQAAATAMAGSGSNGGSGSASSVAIGSAGIPGMLALPANSYASTNADPFAASLAVAPPSYVQMSEMEKKQRLLAEEQIMWQQYARDGMPGNLGMAKMQPNSYSMGDYRHS